MHGDTDAKSQRLLSIYIRLTEGMLLNKAELAAEFGVTQRSIQRDMDDLRYFLIEERPESELLYDRKRRGYRLRKAPAKQLTGGETLAVCKILLESRSLRQDEMLPILDKLLSCCIPEDQKKAAVELLANEQFHYIAPHHGQPVLGRLWELGQTIQQRRVIEIQYERLKEPKLVTREVKPVGIMFSEHYFYLLANIDDPQTCKDFAKTDDPFPTIYRIDRIRDVQVTDKKFGISYQQRFKEGEYRSYTQYMFGGEPQRVEFRYTGISIEAVLDRLPAAEIVECDGGGYLVKADTFGHGILMWLLSQGSKVEVISPASLRNTWYEEARRIVDNIHSIKTD